MNPIKLTAVAAALLVCMPAMADNIVMQASSGTGSVRLTLDAGSSATVKWADGSTEVLNFDGSLMELNLKSENFTITSSGKISTLLCPSNTLQSVDLSKAPYLVEVNVQDCGLSQLKFSSAVLLRYLNVAGNPLGNSIIKYSMPALQSLVVAGCGLTELPDPELMPNLTILWAQDNDITSGALRKFEALQEVYINNNHISTITVPTTIRTVTASGNKLTRMDARSLTGLTDLDLTDNALTTLYTDAANNVALEHFYVHENQLSFKQLPTVYDAATGANTISRWSIEPQHPYQIDSNLDVNASLSINTPIGKNAWGVTLNPTVIWLDSDGNQIVQNVDYSETGVGRFTFLKDLGPLTGYVTCPEYPGVTLLTTPITIGKGGTVGIDEITSARSSLSISVSGTSLTIQALTPDTPLTVTNAAGAMIYSGNLSGSWSRELAPGTYVVNNTKVIVGTR